MSAVRLGPWTGGDARRALLPALGGAGVAFTSWWGASGTAALDRQVTWTVVAVLSVVLIGLGSFLWLVAGRRAVAARRAEVIGAVERMVHAAGPTGAASLAAAFVALDGSPRYHRPECLLVAGKAGRRGMVTGDVALLGRRPCEMCRP